MVFAATGLCLGIAFGPSRAPVLDAILAIAAALLVAGMARAKRVGSVLLLPLPFFVAGLALTALRSPPAESVTSLPDYSENVPRLFEGIVAEAPEQRPGEDRLVVDLLGSAPDFTAPLEPIHGRIRVRIPETEVRSGATKEMKRRRALCGEPGDRIRFFGRARVPDEALSPIQSGSRAVAARRGIALIGNVSEPDLCARARTNDRLTLVTRMERTRSRLHAHVDRLLEPPASGIVRAFATGDRAGIPKEIDEAFRASGLSHLLAVSGLNLAIVSGMFVFGLGFLLRRTPLAPHGAERIASLVSIPFVLLYTLLVGASPSAVRAAIMVLALIGARALRRTADTWSALALALILMLAWDPATLGDVGFQLSFAAVAALLRLQPVLAERLHLKSLHVAARLPAEVMVASLAATIGTAPLIGRHFFRISLVGVLANVPAAPLSSLVLVPLSLLGSLLAFVSETLARPVLGFAGLAARALVEIAHVAAGLPFAEVFIPRPSMLECVLFYGASIGLAARSTVVRRFGVGFFAAFVLSVAGSQLSRRFSSDVEIAFLPVGQGDSAVLELPGGHVAVIDAGPGNEAFDAGELVIAPWLHHRRIGTIDLLVLTHPHADHVGGAPSLARRFRVREIWWNGDRRERTPELEALLASTPSKVVRPGESRAFGDARLEVLGPVATATAYEDVNDASVVVRLSIGEKDVLFTGDAEALSEHELVANGANVEAEILKVGHHGSRSSSSEELLERVSPKWAVMSLARGNGFGFPHREAVERLEKHGARVLRTDTHGLVLAHLDETSVEVTPYRSP